MAAGFWNEQDYEAMEKPNAKAQEIGKRPAYQIKHLKRGKYSVKSGKDKENNGIKEHVDSEMDQ